MPAAIIHLLEVVQVDDEHAERMRIPPGPAQLLTQPLVKIASAVNARHLIDVDKGQDALELRARNQPGTLQDLLNGEEIVKRRYPETHLAFESLLQLFFMLGNRRPDPNSLFKREAPPGELEKQLDVEIVIRTGERGYDLLQSLGRIQVPVLTENLQQVDPLRLQFLEFLCK